MKSRKRIKLIFHIGAGKTGTSSIQKTLKSNEIILRDKKTKYLGFMLEFAYEKKYEWQKASMIGYFHQLPSKDKKEQLYDVLDSTIAKSYTDGIEKLLLVNESFLGRMNDVVPVLKRLKEEKK